MKNGTLFILSAPSGGGKTSLLKAAREKMPRLAAAVSHTSRSPRPGEVEGQHYYFVDEARFNQMVEDGEFLEHARVFDHAYGTSKQALTKLLAAAVDAVLDIDWQGARQIRQYDPECISIFILPPSLTVLEQRLRGRGQDSESIIAGRMQQAMAEMSHYSEFDHVLINDDFDMSLQGLIGLFSASDRVKQPSIEQIEQILAS